MSDSHSNHSYLGEKISNDSDYALYNSFEDRFDEDK